MVRFLGVLSLCCILAIGSFSQTSKVDSLKLQLDKTTGKEKVDTYLVLAGYAVLYSPTNAFKYAFDGLKLAREIHYREGEAALLVNLGFIYSTLGDYQNALRYSQMSYEIYKDMNNRKGLASAYSAMGTAYVFMGRYSKALDYNLQALAIREESGEPIDVSKSLNGIGLVYHHLGQYEKAIDYYQKSQTIRKQIGDTVGYIRTTHNIGYSEFKRGRYDEAMRYHSEALQLAEKSGYKGATAYAHYNIGIVYEGKGEYATAVMHLKQSLKIYLELSQKYGAVEALNSLGSVYGKLGKIGDAITALQEAVKYGQEIHALDQLRMSYQQLYAMYEKIGNTPKAYSYYRQFAALEDTLFNQEESNRIAEITIQYEQEKKEHEIELLKKEALIKNLSIEKSRYHIQLLIAGVAILVLLTVSLVVRSRYVNKNKIILEGQKKELEKLNAELQDNIENIKVLSGLLPICSSCKKIRNDTGYWEQLEMYITRHSDAKFTHGICPDCMEILYPEAYQQYKKDMGGEL